VYSYSFWEQRYFFSDNDLIIIGSGIVGLGAAYFYKKQFPEKQVLVLERTPIPSGASTRNAGFACYGSLGEIADNLQTHSLNEMLQLMERRYKGLNLLRNTLGDSAIDYVPCGSYELFDNDSDFENALKYLDLLNTEASKFLPDAPYSIASNKIKTFGFKNIKHLIYNRFEGALNSGKIYGALLKLCISNNVKILNGITVETIDKQKQNLYLQNGQTIPYKKLLVCTNAFAKQLIPHLEIKPGRGLVLVSKPIKNLKINSIFHYQKGFYYFRNVENRLLLGGGRNLDFEGEETTAFGTNPLIKQALINLATNSIIPYTTFKIEYEWSGIMAFGANKQPIIKEVHPNLYCAVRMGGMGVAIGLQVASEAVEMLNSN
jgi:glycine/D-amino acid oxidase-like deaminating enzyme